MSCYPKLASRIVAHAAAIGAAFFASAVYPQTFGAEGLMRAVVTATDAYLPMPTEFVASGRVDNVFPDPQGRYALIGRTDRTRITVSGPPRPVGGGGVSLDLYDSHTGRVRVIWDQAAPEEATPVVGSVEFVRWFDGSDTALASVVVRSVNKQAGQAMDDTKGQLLFIQATPTMRRITTLSQGPSIVSKPSAASRIAIVQTWDSDGSGHPAVPHFESVNAQGVVVALPEVDGSSYFWSRMSADGETAYFVRHAKPTDAASPSASEKFLVLNLKTHVTSLVAEIPASQPPTPAASPDPQLRLESHDLSDRPAASHAADAGQAPTLLKPLYLARGDHGKNVSQLPGSLMVAPHADQSVLLADNSAILYQSEHALFAVPLLRFSLSTYMEEVRRRTMTNAKQVGLAMKMYAADYDGFLPLSSDTKGMSPYISNGHAFDDPATGAMSFHYLLDGQNESTIQSPATQVTGYLDSVLGRATIYGDGHVTWKDPN